MKGEDLKELKEALHFMNMKELKAICSQLSLPHQGQKAGHIYCILTFLETGKIIKTAPLPKVSKAQKKILYPLAPQTCILSGNYKNDVATRAFMKTLIGEHFHFTGFGQDWIKDRWKEGKPPTYAEFAAFWQKEHETRKKKKATLKKEWAYLTFIQKHSQDHPHISRQQLSDVWEKHRKEQVEKVKKILKRYPP